MAEHPFASTTMWGQPYGSPFDAWVALPFVALLGHTVEALRLPVFLLGLGLVPLAWLLASRVHREAALPAALLVACPPAYFLLLSALPPPFYATTLVLAGLSSGWARGRVGRRAVAAQDAPAWRHPRRSSVGRRLGPRPLDPPDVGERRRGLGGAGSLAAGVARRPLAAPRRAAAAPRRRAPPSGARPSPSARRRGSSRSPGRETTTRSTSRRCCRGCTSRWAASSAPTFPWWPTPRTPSCGTPAGGSRGLVLVWGFGLVARRSAAWTSRGRRRRPARRGGLAAARLPAAAAFGAPHHPLPDAAVPARSPSSWSRRPLWPVGPGAASSCAPALAACSSRGRPPPRGLAPHRPRGARPSSCPTSRPCVRRSSAGASATRTPPTAPPGASRGRATAPSSPPSRGTSASATGRCRCSTRCASRHDVAWVLTSRASRPTCPRPTASRRRCGAQGGPLASHARRARSTVFLDFTPPWSPVVEPLAGAGAAGDGDIDDEPSASTPRAPTVFRLDPPRRLGGPHARCADRRPRRCCAAWTSRSAPTASSFEVVASRRRRQEREDLRWVNGHPQYVLDHDILPGSPRRAHRGRRAFDAGGLGRPLGGGRDPPPPGHRRAAAPLGRLAGSRTSTGPRAEGPAREPEARPRRLVLEAPGREHSVGEGRGGRVGRRREVSDGRSRGRQPTAPLRCWADTRRCPRCPCLGPPAVASVPAGRRGYSFNAETAR